MISKPLMVSQKEGGILCFGMFFYCYITKMFGLSPKCLDKRKNKYLKFIHSEVAFMLTNAQRKVDKFVLEPYV